jgi:hypothetical protein
LERLPKEQLLGKVLEWLKRKEQRKRFVQPARDLALLELYRERVVGNY